MSGSGPASVQRFTLTEGRKFRSRRWGNPAVNDYTLQPTIYSRFAIRAAWEILQWVNIMANGDSARSSSFDEKTTAPLGVTQNHSPERLAPALRTGSQRHAQLDSEDPDVRGALVAAGIDNVLNIRLNVCSAEDVERVENFLYKLIGLHAETGMRMAGDVFGLGLPYIAGNAVITGCYTAGLVGSLRPRGPVVESSEHLKVLK